MNDARWPQFEKVISYDNDQLIRELVPFYKRMAEHFASHMWLAEESTMIFYGMLVEYVEVWNRYLQQALPVEVLPNIGHTEGKLKPFYEELERQTKRLQSELRK